MKSAKTRLQSLENIKTKTKVPFKTFVWLLIITIAATTFNILLSFQTAQDNKFQLINL